MSNNEYSNFEELAKNEVGNYTIECIDRGANITIIAPHGGRIEPRTDAITKAIAGHNLNYYGFIAERGKIEGKKSMHITSHKFDEHKALELVGKSEIVIAIHGCNNDHSTKDDSKEIFMGGLDRNLISKLQETLENASLPICSLDTCDNFPSHFKGENPDNICNKGTTGKGIQFELTNAFRNDGALCGKFISTVSHCLKTL